MNRHIFRPLVVLLAFFLIESCARVPITGRKQMNLLPAGQMMSMSNTQYSDVLTKSKTLPESDSRVQLVRNVGNKIAGAVEKFLKDNHQQNRVKDFEWEFNVIDEETVNAWCMPGGKVCFYTGILPITSTEAGLAVVMGHEVAHAVAKHGNERMSQQLVVQLGGIGLATAMQEKPEAVQNLFMLSYGVGSQLGSLKYSRTHESEADKMGLVFMAMAGYNPEEAVAFWQRMAESGGGQPPEFLSTHPNHDTRIADLNAFMPEAKKHYKP